MARSLDRGFALSTELLQRLKDEGIVTVKDLLGANPLLLIMKIGLSHKEFTTLVQNVAAKVVPRPKSALEIYQQSCANGMYLSTGVKGIDDILRGGLPIGCITEIVGPPGIGKSQFLMGCCVATISHKLKNSSLLTSNRGGVIYFDTELKLDVSRLVEIAVSTNPSLYSNAREDSAAMKDKLLSSISVHRPTTCSELLSMIENLQDTVIQQGSALIVIDSIAVLARKEGLNEQDKELYVVRQSALLKKIAEMCRCTVLVTNQVVLDSYSILDYDEDKITDISGQVYKPSMGVTWHHCISTRLVMNKMSPESQLRCSFSPSAASTPVVSNTGYSNDASPRAATNFSEIVHYDRMLSLTKSPVAPKCSLPYTIQSSGLVVGASLSL